MERAQRLRPVAIARVALSAFAVAFTACASTSASTEPFAAQRTAELRARSPPDHATRNDVTARWGTAQVAWRRPLGGWTNPFVVAVERRVATPVARAEEYVAPMRTSAGFTLEHVWFFFDADDIVVDVMWVRMGD
jgi:hypothetical protein